MTLRIRVIEEKGLRRADPGRGRRGTGPTFQQGSVSRRPLDRLCAWWWLTSWARLGKDTASLRCSRPAHLQIL